MSDQVALNGSGHIPAPDSSRFITEPYGVTSVSPPPWSRVTARYLSRVSLEFNIDMDTASVDSSFALVEVGGQTVQGKYLWASSRIVEFSFNERLRYDATYRISLPRQARRATGESLTHDFESYFLAVRW